MTFIEIVVDEKGSALVEIDGRRNPRTAREICDSLPLEAGDVSYRTPGSAFCIFYGGSHPYSAINKIPV